MREDNIEHDLYLALKELVELRDMKEELVGSGMPRGFIGRIPEYDRRKPLAWEAARKAIRAYEGDNN